ncbi:hypothetical protein NDI37_19700 [Funiculus sociatus GB2-A5]|uniref:Uncharacterized protein n=1 Tax=Funiculus sociatus GB2-A5 TaxID=2933946 RepID=A0ABV0JTF7_9CYAN|nr:MULTISPECIES: hypothetical protein [unclassified Trichocoleus]MBD1907609.1 hypothetical protein [Trichocoleus sp. FACHB-832]MBD2063728.1 hypothetical protein [Trichocoleus sp. FACHB-6]
MIQLKIVDLDFCEFEIPSNEEVIGGISISNPTGSFSTSVSSNKSSGYYVSSFFDKSTGAFGYSIGFGYSGAVAGAAAGAASDGYQYTSSYSEAYTY